MGGVLTDAQTAEIAATKQVAEFVHVFEAKGKESGVAERDEEALCSSGWHFFPTAVDITSLHKVSFPSPELLNPES